MTFNVAIVEDDAEQTRLLRKYIERFRRDTGEAVLSRFFEDGDEITDGYRAEYDVIFMDIEMKRLDGMTAAAKIREFDQDVAIIFITNMAKYAIKGYAVGALNYLLKPVSYFAFASEMTRLVERAKNKQSVYIIIKNDDGVRKIDSSDVFFIEVIRHKLFIHTVNGDFEQFGTMKEMEQRLSACNFCKCNNCYLVNLTRVKGIINGFTLVGEYRLAMSRPRKKVFMEALTTYLGGA